MASQVFSGRWKYNRSTSTEQAQLEEALAKRYGLPSPHCCVVPSGMAAITTVLHAVAEEKATAVVYASELYSDTPWTIESLAHLFDHPKLQRFDVRACPYTQTCMSIGIVPGFMTAMDSMADETCVLVVVESCSNPHGVLFDLGAIAEARRRHPSRRIVTLLDNTWLSSAISNPFTHASATPIDYVVESLTKYNSGGTVIAGAIWTRDPIGAENIRIWGQLLGHHVNPLVAQRVLDMLPSLDERVAMSSQLTRDVVETLRAAGATIRHPTTMTPLVPSVFTIAVHATEARTLECLTALDKAGIFDNKTSYGGAVTSTEPEPTQDPAKRFGMCMMDAEPRTDPAEYPWWVRVAIGYGEKRTAAELANILLEMTRDAEAA